MNDTTKDQPQRQFKLMSIDAAVAGIQDGATVATGGWIFNSQPMALVRALIRQGAKDLVIAPAPGSIAPDMLIGAGRAKATFCVFISFEHHGLAPHFRKRSEAGTLKVIEMDGPSFAGGMRAGICDLPYALIPDLATDLPRVNPEYYRPMERVPGQRRMLNVPAIKPDVCLLHAQQADIYGNVQFIGSPFFDAMLAQCSKRVIVSVDRIVSTDTIARASHLTKLPSVMVDAVVEAPYGAHPTASPSLYRHDDKHFREYVKASRTDEAFKQYLDQYAYGAAEQGAYLDKIGASRLAGLNVSESNL